jgi:hypothetical protein
VCVCVKERMNGWEREQGGNDNTHIHTTDKREMNGIVRLKEEATRLHLEFLGAEVQPFLQQHGVFHHASQGGRVGGGAGEGADNLVFVCV